VTTFIVVLPWARRIVTFESSGRRWLRTDDPQIPAAVTRSVGRRKRSFPSVVDGPVICVQLVVSGRQTPATTSTIQSIHNRPDLACVEIETRVASRENRDPPSKLKDETLSLISDT